MKTGLFLAILIAGFLAGCNIVNPPEGIPSYIYIPAATLTSDSVTQGSASQKIVDAWVTVGNTYLGAYELPATIPVLLKGNQHVVIRAGVKENGIAATRLPYPFYTTFETDAALEEKEIDTLHPAFRYDSVNTHFDLIEDFENPSMGFIASPRNKATFGITRQPDSVFEGSGSFLGTLKSDTEFLEVYTSSSFVLPRGKAVWLEVNYKTDAPIEFGYLSGGSNGIVQHFAAGVNPNNEWNKIYFNLTNLISIEPSSNTFRLVIGAAKPNGKTAAHILLDNIKLLHLE